MKTTLLLLAVVAVLVTVSTAARPPVPHSAEAPYHRVMEGHPEGMADATAPDADTAADTADVPEEGPGHHRHHPRPPHHRGGADGPSDSPPAGSPPSAGDQQQEDQQQDQQQEQPLPPFTLPGEDAGSNEHHRWWRQHWNQRHAMHHLLYFILYTASVAALASCLTARVMRRRFRREVRSMMAPQLLSVPVAQVQPPMYAQPTPLPNTGYSILNEKVEV